MMTVSGLTRQYGERLAVDDITFDVAGGRVTGFGGPNGAGKSTTMPWRSPDPRALGSSPDTPPSR
jgi:ABC-type multidrug transport system ATPase subunit